MLPLEEEITTIQQVLQGNTNAYATLVNRYQGYVFTLVLRYVADRETAEELAQDVFIKAYRCLADFRGNSKFSTWLYTIVHTTCLSHTRKLKEATVYPGDEGILALDGRHDAPAIEMKQRRQAVEHAIQLLPAGESEVITLFYLAEQSIEEIGRITGLTPANIKVRLFRGRQRLKEIISHSNSFYA